MTEFNPYSSHLIYKANNPQTYLSSNSNFPGKDYQSWLSAHIGIMLKSTLLSLSWRCWDGLQWTESLDKLLIFSTTFGFLPMQVHTCSHTHRHTHTHTHTHTILPLHSILTNPIIHLKAKKTPTFFPKGNILQWYPKLLHALGCPGQFSESSNSVNFYTYCRELFDGIY